MNLKSKKAYRERLESGEVHIAFDIDGTIQPWIFPKWTTPFPWVKPFFKTLTDNGCIVWVFSARFNEDFYGKDLADMWFEQCLEWLEEHGLREYVKPTRFKPPADVIFDDLGRRLDGKNTVDVRLAINSVNVLRWKSRKTIEFPKELYEIIRRG